MNLKCATHSIQGVLDLHEFWARNKIVQAKFVLVKLCTSMFSKIRASEILSTCYPRNGVYLKIRASEIRASQGPPVVRNEITSSPSSANRTPLNCRSDYLKSSECIH